MPTTPTTPTHAYLCPKDPWRLSTSSLYRGVFRVPEKAGASGDTARAGAQAPGAPSASLTAGAWVSGSPSYSAQLPWSRLPAPGGCLTLWKGLTIPAVSEGRASRMKSKVQGYEGCEPSPGIRRLQQRLRGVPSALQMDSGPGSWAAEAGGG